MLEANMFFLELAILFILILIGFIRGRGMWFFFTMILSSLVMVDLADNSFQLSYISGGSTTPIQMPTAIIFIPIIIMALAFISIVKMYSRTGAV